MRRLVITSTPLELVGDLKADLGNIVRRFYAGTLDAETFVALAARLRGGLRELEAALEGREAPEAVDPLTIPGARFYGHLAAIDGGRTDPNTPKKGA